MKRTRLILVFAILFPFFAAADESSHDKVVFVQWQRTLQEYKIPGVPVFFCGTINSLWIGAGFLLNSPESFGEESPFRYIMGEFPLFQAALLLQGKSLSSSVIFCYEKNDTWGLSARFSF